MKKTFFLGIAVCLLASCGKLTVDNTPVASIELDRYVGTWYEIARFDHRFERGLTQPQAEYSLREDGKISAVRLLPRRPTRRHCCVCRSSVRSTEITACCCWTRSTNMRWSAAVRMIFCGFLPVSRSWTKRPSRSSSPKPNAAGMIQPNCCGCIDFAGLPR